MGLQEKIWGSSYLSFLFGKTEVSLIDWINSYMSKLGSQIVGVASCSVHLEFYLLSFCNTLIFVSGRCGDLLVRVLALVDPE